ncbi:MAG TPA: hypothetical protein VF157_16010 [Chloroflexota bacterium]
MPKTAMPQAELKLSPQPSIRSSRAEQLSHRLFMGDRPRPTCGHPLLVGGKRCLDLSFFQDLSRGAAFYSPKPTKVGERHNGGRLPTKVDHLIWLMLALATGRLRGHGTTLPVSAITRRPPRPLPWALHWPTRVMRIELATELSLAFTTWRNLNGRRAQVPAHLRDQIRIEATVCGSSVTIVECRPLWRADPTEWSKVRVAQLRYNATTLVGARERRYAPASGRSVRGDPGSAQFGAQRADQSG